jgi:hypothetical protein
MKELNALIQEIVDFGDVVSYAENPADPNFQNACDLFSQYLDWRFRELKEHLDAEGLPSSSQWNISDLENLNRLMLAPKQSAEACIAWTHDLLQYCLELQRSKPIAA